MTSQPFTDMKKDDDSQYLRSIVEHIPIATQVIADGRFIDCNQASIRLFRCKNREELIGLKPGNFSPAVQADGRTSLEALLEHIEKALKYGVQDFQWIHTRKDGEVFPARVRLTAAKQKTTHPWRRRLRHDRPAPRRNDLSRPDGQMGKLPGRYSGGEKRPGRLFNRASPICFNPVRKSKKNRVREQ